MEGGRYKRKGALKKEIMESRMGCLGMRSGYPQLSIKLSFRG